MSGNPGPTLEGLDEAEMRQVVVLGQLVIGMALGQPAGRLFNTCLWIQSMLCNSDAEFALGCVAPLKTLTHQIELHFGDEPPVGPQPASGGPTIH